MFASELISETLPPVKLSDTVGDVLDWMNEFKINQLPIVKEGKYIGLLHENDLLDAENALLPVREVIYLPEHEGYGGRVKLFVLENKHFYEVLSLMSQHELEVVPVTNVHQDYLGVISIHDLSKHLGEMFAATQEGGIVIVETLQNNYSLGEIGRIVESANAKVLSLYVNPVPDSPRVQITLKINLLNPAPVNAAFERFNYTVVMSFFYADELDDYRRNMNLLMKMIE